MKERISELVEQIVDVPVLQIWGANVKIVSLIQQKHISEKICEQNVKLAFPQLVEQIIEVSKRSSQDRILQREVEPCWRWNAGRGLCSRVACRRLDKCRYFRSKRIGLRCY